MRKQVLITALALVFMLVAGVSKAQDSKFLLGGGATYASDISSFGFFVKANYAITEKIEVAADFNYFLPKKVAVGMGMEDVKYNYMSFDVDGHFAFLSDEKMTLYGLAGLNILMVRIPSYEVSYPGAGTMKFGGTTDSNMGLNLGAGGRFGLSDKLSAFGEVKYVISEGGYVQVNAGILFAL